MKRLQEEDYICSPNGTGNEYVPGATMGNLHGKHITSRRIYFVGTGQGIDKRDNSFFVQLDDESDNMWEVEAGNYWHWDAVNNRDDRIQ